MGTSSSQHVDYATNEYLLRFVGKESISPNNPFWNRFLTFTLKPPLNKAEDEALMQKILPLCEALKENNLQTGNLAALLHVLFTVSPELLVSTQVENNMFTWQTFNSLFILRCYTKYLVQSGKEVDLLRHIETKANGKDDEESLLNLYVNTLIDLIVFLPVVDLTYGLYVEAINCLIVLLSVQLFTTQTADQLQVYRLVMESDRAEKLTMVLVQRYVDQPRPPQSGGSLLLGLASDVWSYLTGGQGPETSTLGNQAVLLLLLLINHCNNPRNPYRETLNNYSENLGGLLTTLCSTLDREETTLFLYALVHRNQNFKTYLVSRSDIESLVLPILSAVYTGPDENCHHVYMSLIILLILTEDPLFNKTVHSTMLKTVPWYTERMVLDISLGGLMILVTTRTVQYNLLKMRDKYLHTNCLAALANMSSQFYELHPYVCQRLVGLFQVLAKTHARANSEQGTVQEALRILLEVINSCLSHQLIHNTNLVYTLLYKKHVFEPFKNDPAFQDVIQNLDMVIEFFTTKLEKEEDQNTDVDVVMARVQQAALQWPTDRLKKFPELKFKYVEEDKPEEFFIPYVWSLVSQQSSLHWDASLFKQC
ncbi:dymeclin [Macrosteles quadrilineatus]|uniref:dymeclin n=1 Tax=Macrosteles quadrilineatus TaxID=74068 RepID=UPI0023E223ED|nr:dymeclin [Macrosteles quadrilineatus]